MKVMMLKKKKSDRAGTGDFMKNVPTATFALRYR